MLAVLADVVYAVRTLRKRPAFAVTAVATLALGIGSTAAIFSVVNAVLLQPLPYREPHRLVHVWPDLRNRNVTRFPWAPADFHDLRTQATVFTDVAALTTGRFVVVGDNGQGDAEQLRAGNATPNLFRMLGARMAQRFHRRRRHAATASACGGHRCPGGAVRAAAAAESDSQP